MANLLLNAFLAAFISTVDTHRNWGASYIMVDVYQHNRNVPHTCRIERKARRILSQGPAGRLLRRSQHRNPRTARQGFVSVFDNRRSRRNNALLRHLPRYRLFDPAEIRQSGDLLPADRYRRVHRSQMVQKRSKSPRPNRNF